MHGELTEAEHEFREVLRLDAGNAEALANLGSIYYLRSNWAAAAKELRRCHCNTSGFVESTNATRTLRTSHG